MLKYLASAAWLLLGIISAAAQETSVPLDSAGTVHVIDAPLERQLHLFDDVAGFLEARLFQLADSSYVLEISSEADGRLTRERRALTTAAAEDFRREVSARLGRQRGPMARELEDARGRFLTGMSILSLGYYGWAVPYVMQVESGRVYGGVYMLTSASGILVPFLLSRDAFVPEGAAALGLYGGSRGIFYGILLDVALAGEHARGRDMVGIGLMTSLAGLVGGYQSGWNARLDAGTAGAIGAYGDFGLYEGVMAGVLINEQWLDADHPNGVAAVTLLGGVAGMGAGALFSSRQSYGRGDNAVLRTTGLLGIAVPVTALDLSGDVHWQSFAAATMAGTAVGLAAGHWLTRDVDLTKTQGTLIELGAMGGGLVGLGLAYLTQPVGEDQSDRYTLLGTLGAAGGFALTYKAMLHNAPAARKRSAWDLDLAPEGMIALAAGSRLHLPPNVPLPLARLSVRF